MINLQTVCGANNLNTKLLFYNVHDSHVDNRSIHILRSNYIKPLILKAGGSWNDHPNDNGPNIKLKGIYDQARTNFVFVFKSGHRD